MTRVRKLTSKDFDRLFGGESVDTQAGHVTRSPQSLVKPTVFSQTSTSPKTRKASSSFHHRIFSRPSVIPGQREEENDLSDTPGPQDVVSETTPPTPRKTMMMMTGWPFSRSAPRKSSRPTEDSEDIAAAASTSLSPDVKNPGGGIQVSSHSPTSPYYSVTSYAPTSTSSLGSLVPTHECLFHVASRDFTNEQTSTCHRYSDSSRVAAYAPPPRSSRVAITAPSDPILPDGDNGGSGARGNRRMVKQQLHQDQASGMSEPMTQTPSFELTTEEETYSRRSVATTTEPEMLDKDLTPRAGTFGSPVTMSLPAPAIIATMPKRGRRGQCLNIDVLALRPAVGATPHAPSETESFSTSACSTGASSPPTSPITQDSFPAAFPVMKPSPDTDTAIFSSPPRVLHSTTPPNPRVPAVCPDDSSSRSNSHCGPDSVTMASSASVVASPRSRKRAISRSVTPPPFPRPKGPLPAVPSSAVPPVPPLPPLLNKLSMNVNASPQTMIPLPSRSSTMTGAAATQANAGTAALPPSPPGALRLPSRLSWVNSVRAVLPSPPASPTKKPKILSGSDKPGSSSKVEKKQSGELERRPRPMSVGVIEATEDLNGANEVRRTKSILLLGSRSKSNMSLGTKRVQIHADVNEDSDVGGDGVGIGAPSVSTAAEASPSVSAPAPASTSLRKQKRKSNSAAAALGLGFGLGRPTVFSSGSYPRVPSLPVPMPTMNSCRQEVVVFPLERRHSAPLMSTFDPKTSLDWTLSLPFSTDVPGNKILLPSLSEPQLKKEKEEEDWTLCMPLKLRAIDVPIHKLCDGDGEEGVSVDNSEVVTVEEEERTAMQLPTPSPSPTWSTPRSGVVLLDPTENEEQENEDKKEEEKEERRSVFSVVEPEGRPASPASTLGPHVGGLDLVGGRGKRASGWHVYGWFDEVRVDTDVTGPVVPAVSEGKLVKSHVSVFRKNDTSSSARHPSQDSIVSSATSMSDTVFYSARSSWLTN